MTKNEIQRLISSKIKGFGHMIDDVSLAKILNGIINLIPGDLPVATADTLGGVKVGDGLKINPSGVLYDDTIQKITIELSEVVDNHSVSVTIRAIHKDNTVEVLEQFNQTEEGQFDYTFPEALISILSTAGAVLVYSNTMLTEESQVQLGYMMQTTSSSSGTHVSTSCLDANSNWIIPIDTTIDLIPDYTTLHTSAIFRFGVGSWSEYV